jgi:hypothetical protein
MLNAIFQWSVALAISAVALNGRSDTQPGSTISTSNVGWGVAYFEPPQSIGTPLDDVARVYSGVGLAARIEGRLRLETDASLNAAARELIRRRLVQRG